MQLSATPPSTPPRPAAFNKRPFFIPAKPSKWYLPAMAVIALGFGAANLYTNQQQRHEQAQEEFERLQRNRQLMDAYGDKDNLHDIERALAVYEIQ
ncbi:hypothetical protein N8T08_011189 [Aspergillus melleus]|uniref:Uncharacterized protein n=1 Tax=Aspergillus melleus TaxID=138277 RepID=A0ACC3AQ31_9EURO|nr:uncharacterized protein LDX57_009139 [Aspergillus melleus]KAH8431476.1 hypothetical protein LDX57_009139 [Aspergillus melleus]KAK1139792.1 hypothetical protein N8T08_011189 [Aspergillus melleus]